MQVMTAYGKLVKEQMQCGHPSRKPEPPDPPVIVENPKPRVYIAGPFFNPRQVELISFIERMLDRKGYPYYSPRLHSGSANLTAEERKNPESWTPVFLSNIDELMACQVTLAVMEFLLPENTRLVLKTTLCNGLTEEKEISVPDSGTVYEAGGVKLLGLARQIYNGGTPGRCYAYYEKKPAQANLMLSHGVDGVLYGRSFLDAFFTTGVADQVDARDGLCPFLHLDIFQLGWSEETEVI